MSLDTRPDTRTAAPRGRRALATVVALWLAANAYVWLAAPGSLPFDWPARAGLSTGDVLLETNVGLLQVLVLMLVVRWLTRRRTDPGVAARAPERRQAWRETLGLLGYGACGLAGGHLLASAMGWSPFGLHLAGTLFGTHAHVEPLEALAWAAYNLVVYAIIPLAWFGRRYSATSLGLRSSDRRNDLLVVAVVLALETCSQVLVLRPDSLDLPAGVLVRGAALTFVLYLLGTGLPAMVFLYAILVPRFLRLTGSVTATVLCGGLTYAALHVWDAWAVLDSPRSALLSLVFVVLTYLAPGMFKTYLTVRTGNAWVHLWAYHAFAPHTLVDTPHVVHVFRLS
ncbi:hypothetical protein [Nocardioides sp. zg-1228]|uniref:hypothetical protein n=1 Tax=Nocardioides sp. zg-1228 TaxID=2763008 RepID=UPI0016431C3F|nr:hypothetical protein [Nocardioides sp. zg-1228]MBC2932522.1 hypothetical protein [Nocardioides sp. zg-1228]QSF58022.1 hypothetical protein JX575_01995 [Nocardioides sp. zg-1228]